MNEDSMRAVHLGLQRLTTDDLFPWLAGAHNRYGLARPGVEVADKIVFCVGDDDIVFAIYAKMLGTVEVRRDCGDR